MQRNFENDIEIVIDNKKNIVQPQTQIRVREQCVKIYEIDQYKIDNSLKFIQRFFQIIKQYAERSHAHLKILVNLVNNLIISEDYVHLVDHTLHVQNRLKFSQHEFQENGTHNQRSVKQTTPDELAQTQPLKNLINNQQEEIQKLVKIIQQGENDTNYLKQCFAKLIDKFENLNQTQDRDDNIGQDIHIQNSIQMPEFNKDQMERDLFNETGKMFNKKTRTGEIRTHPQNFDNYEKGFYTERGYIDPHKRFSSNRQSATDLLNLRKQLDEKDQEIEHLQDQIDDLKNNLDIANEKENRYRKKYQQQNDLFRDNEDLKRQLEQLQERVSELRDENSEFKRKIQQKDTKIQSIQDQLQQQSFQSQNRPNQKPEYNRQQSLANRKLQNELNDVKQRLKEANKKNKRLIRQIEQKSEYDIQRHINEYQDVTDLLKCLFIQTQHIDETILQEQRYEEQLQTLENQNELEDEQSEDSQQSLTENDPQNDSQYYIEEENNEDTNQEEDQLIEQQQQQKPSIKITEPMGSDFYKSDLKKPQIIQGTAKEMNQEDIDEEEELIFAQRIDPDTIVKHIETDEETEKKV